MPINNEAQKLQLALNMVFEGHPVSFANGVIELKHENGVHSVTLPYPCTTENVFLEEFKEKVAMAIRTLDGVAFPARGDKAVKSSVELAKMLQAEAA